MKTYARVIDGTVVEIIGPMQDTNGNEIPIEDRFHPDIVSTLEDVTGRTPVVLVGFSRVNGVLAPYVAPIEPADAARARALTDIRVQRAPILDALTGIGYRALVAGNSDVAQEVLQLQENLLAVTSLSAFTAAQTYDDMKAVIMARYTQLAQGASPTVVTAFNGLLS